MSAAELDAFNLGAAVGLELAAALGDIDGSLVVAGVEPATDAEVDALVRLGPEMFAYWVLRGVLDAVELSEG